MAEEKGMDPEKSQIDDDVDDETEEYIENPLKRAFLVYFSPTHVYKSLAVKSSKLDWIIPLTLSLLLSLFLLNVGYEYLQNDNTEARIKRIENNTTLSDEQKSQTIDRLNETMGKMVGIQRIMINVSAVIGTIVWALVIALVIMLISKVLFEKTIAYGDAFKIGALGSMTTLLSSIVKLPLIFYFESFSRAKTSLGLLLPEGMEEGFLVKLIDIDIFLLWYVIIISIGMSVFANSSIKKAFISLLLLWLVFRIVVISISGSLSSMGM
ncbi:MAG: YIP1 family protein [Candidatus Latescibacteria bacterium]|nr:YIP1 family protein [Candidatus Latescibacterota bacterium]